MAYRMKALLFDLDETIIARSESLRKFVMWQAKGMLRREIIDPEYFCQRFMELESGSGVIKNKVYSQIVEEFDIADWTISELVKSYELCFSGFCHAKSGVLDAIKQVSRLGLKLGVVSNGRSPFQERNFYSLGVHDLFDTIVVSEAVGYQKPDKQIFDLACDDLGVSGQECFFVGDSPVADIDGANTCGMYSIYIPGAYGTYYRKANAICKDYSELVGIVESAI